MTHTHVFASSLAPLQSADVPGETPKDGDGGGGVELAVKPKTRTKKPSMYKVVMLNDDYTPMEFVVMVLEQFFGMSRAQAVDIMMIVHHKGAAIVGLFTYEIAETRVAQVMDSARQHQHPLQCRIEKE